MFWTDLTSGVWRGPLGAFLYRSRGGYLNRVHDRVLDWVFGMETRRQVNPESHGFNPAEANCYVPSEWWAISYILTRIELGETDVFVDLGCGKGRVLKIAARFGFRRLVGIELIPDLAETARNNLRGHRGVEIIEGDARTAPIPQDASLIFLFNPFSADVLLDVIARLERHAAAVGKALRVLYHSPVHHELVLGKRGVIDISSGVIPDECLPEFRLYKIGERSGA